MASKVRKPFVRPAIPGWRRFAMDRRAVPKSGESLHHTNPLKRVTNPESWRTKPKRMRNESSKNPTIKGTYAIRLRESRLGGDTYLTDKFQDSQNEYRSSYGQPISVQ